MRIDLPAVGQSYEHPDLPLSAQVTRNWMPEVNQETGRVVTLQPAPGATVFAEAPDGVDRGMTVWGTGVWKVTGDKFGGFNSGGEYFEVGDIKGTGACSFASSDSKLVIVSSGYVYLFNLANLTEVTDADLESPDYVTYLNNQWIYQGSGSRFAVSDVGSPQTINGLSYASAESVGDALVRPYAAFNQVLYLIGQRSVETWYNSGVGLPPFDRIEGGIIQQGSLSPDSVANNDNFLYLLGDDRRVYQIVSSQSRPISTIPIAREFETYSVDEVAAAKGFCFTLYGQEFYQLRIAGKTWIFNETAGAWSELTVDGRAHPATSHVYAWGKNLIADRGRVLEMDESGTYAGERISRERVTGLVTGELFGAEYIGRELFMSRCEIIIKGIPPVGDAPEIMLSWSDDAGYSYSNERVLQCGMLGNYTFRAVAHQLGRFRERVFRIRVEGRYSIHRMSADIDVSN